MGAWGVEPYDDDKAHDFTLDFFEGIDADARVRSAFEEFAQHPEAAFPVLRAACHLLEQLGRSFVWPGEQLDELLSEGLVHLSALLADDDIASLWVDPDAFREAVQRQITGLEDRRART